MRNRSTTRTTRGAATPMFLFASGLALSVAAAVATRGAERAMLETPAAEQVSDDHGDASNKLTGVPVQVRSVPEFQVSLTPIPAGPAPGGSEADADGEGGIAGTCEVLRTYSGADFTGGQFVMQAGFVETEIAAVSFTVPPQDFPLILNLTEMIFAQQNAQVTTTTEWSLLVWEGNPQTGTLIEVFSSDDLILPHLVMPPGTPGTNVQVMVDPFDPEQIVVQNNGSNMFSVGYRIDKHHNPPTSSCLCVPGCAPCGSLPAVCCPPATSSNAFPTTDPTGLTSPSNNWLWARDCPGATGFCAASAGWHQFSSPGLPSGDWNIRVTYTPVNCVVTTGACCLPGGCEVVSDISCADQGGTFLGAGTNCASSVCPGACCLNPTAGTCQDGLFPEQCEGQDGFFLGESTECAIDGCDALSGACCVPTTGACVNFISPVTCAAAGANWQGQGSHCSVTICFPSGACCLPDGSCTGPVSPEDCDAAGGSFQGHETACGSVNCPQPMGACCLANNNCIATTSTDCPLFGGTWQGPGTNCNDGNGNGTADVCEPPAPACPADVTDDGFVNIFDLLAVLAAWGECADPQECPEDVTGDGFVNIFDLLAILADWGECE